MNLVLPCILLAQGEIILTIEGDSINHRLDYGDLEQFLRTQIQHENEYERYLQLDSVNSHDLNLHYGVRHDPVHIDSLVFRYPGEILLNESVQGQIFRSVLTSRPGHEFENRLSGIRAAYRFFPGPIHFMYMRYGINNVGATITVDPDFTSYFSGLAGAARSEDQTWTVTGELNIHVENLWRTAGLLALNWKRPDSLSQQLDFEVIEPHPFGWPVGIGFRYLQNLWKGNYISTESSFSMKLRTVSAGNIGIGLRFKRVRPTETGRLTGLNYSESRYLVFESSGDTRNDIWLPDKGYAWKAETAFGSRKSVENSESGTFQLRATKYFTISRVLAVEAGIQSDLIWLSNGIIQESDMVHLGGANSLRGYQESSFIVPWYGLSTVEIQYRSGPGSRIYIFNDHAIVGENGDWFASYGIGYIQKTGNTVLELSYGLTVKESIRDGKIHVKFLTYF